MTIAEELDRRSGRPHKSATITDAMKYAFDISTTPDTIGAAVKAADFNPPDEFKVTWMNGTTKLKEDTVTYGTAPAYTGTAPTKTGYTFLGWNSNSAATEALAELPVVTANVTYYAIFQINTYDVVWKNGEETLETDTDVEYGSTPSYGGATPTKDNYTFIGWNTDAEATVALDPLPTVADDTTFYAIFALNTYTITWKQGETTLDTDTVEYGATPAYTGDTPTDGAKTFLGWNSDSSATEALATIPAATADATFFAIFSAN